MIVQDTHFRLQGSLILLLHVFPFFFEFESCNKFMKVYSLFSFNVNVQFIIGSHAIFVLGVDSWDCCSLCEPSRACLPARACVFVCVCFSYLFSIFEKKTIIDSNWFAFKRCVTNVFLFLPLLRKLHKTSTSKLIFDIRPKLPALHISWRRQSIFK